MAYPARVNLRSTYPQQAFVGPTDSYIPPRDQEARQIYGFCGLNNYNIEGRNSDLVVFLQLLLLSAKHVFVADRQFITCGLELFPVEWQNHLKRVDIVFDLVTQ